MLSISISYSTETSNNLLFTYIFISLFMQLTEIGQLPELSSNMYVAENDMLDYNYPYDELPQLKELLEKWGLQCVYQTCVGKNSTQF